MNESRRALLATAAGGLISVIPGLGWAQSAWPGKPVKIKKWAVVVKVSGASAD
jgi:hypothetical protein